MNMPQYFWYPHSPYSQTSPSPPPLPPTYMWLPQTHDLVDHSSVFLYFNVSSTLPAQDLEPEMYTPIAFPQDDIQDQFGHSEVYSSTSTASTYPDTSLLSTTLNAGIIVLDRPSNHPGHRQLPLQKRKKNITWCDVCQKGIEKPSQWENHQRIHSGARPFQCGDCLKTFNTKSNLTRHTRKFHLEGDLAVPRSRPRRVPHNHS